MKSSLFTPFTLGPLTLRNRTVRAAAFEGMGHGHAPTKQLEEYHVSVAAGGVGMTTLAYAAVCRSGLSFPSQLWLRPEIVPGLRTITDNVHRQGAAASIQIGHCGNMSNFRMAGCCPVSASGGFNLYSPTFVRGLKVDELLPMARHYGRAVNLAREAGFDAVEVHAGHGYLISQFLSPLTNRRKDEYGGSFDGRTRFLRLCLDEVMKAAGSDMAVLVKTNMFDGVDGGIEVPEGIRIAKLIEEAGVHALVLSGGFVSRAPMQVMCGRMPLKSMTHYMTPWWLRWGVKAVGRWMIPSVPFREAYFLEEAKRFRRELKLPLCYVGGLIDRAKIDQVLDNGFELVQMARALINMPDFVNRMHNEQLQRCHCTHSNYCIARMYSLDMSCHQHRNDIPPNLLKELDVLT